MGRLGSGPIVLPIFSVPVTAKPMSKRKPTLEELRTEIDRIDDTIHDLLMDRALVVEGVRKLKDDNRPMYRPGREADILYRLATRHSGAFPVQSVLRMWRELIAGTLMLEGPFFIAVQAPEQNDGYLDLARDHFGTFSPIIRHQSAASVIEDVRKGKASVGILPFPERDAEDVWWRYLASGETGRPMVVGRLPFFGRSNARGALLDALVISAIPPTATGRDVTLFAFPASNQISRARLKSAFTASDLDAGLILDWPLPGSGEGRLFVVEVDGFVTSDDERQGGVLGRLEGHMDHLIWLGAYPRPLSDEDLGIPAKSRQGKTRKKS